jgi:multiple antibiotic resistance protein
MELKIQVFTFLFLMLGPFKIIGPFAKITQNATPALTRKIAFRAILLSTIALLLAAVMGENILSNFGIPVPILALSAGIILFLVALLNIIQQFTPHELHQEQGASIPDMNVALNPLAFPTIVTPYGIAAVIVFLALTPDLKGKIIIGVTVLCIMVLNLVIMLLTRHIGKLLLVFLALLGAILGVVQVALGLLIIYNQLKELLKA